MTTMDREGEGLAREPAGGGEGAPADYEALRRAVIAVAQEMEEPLREAGHLARVIGITDCLRDEEREALSFVAFQAVHRLETVSEGWARLYGLCRPVGGEQGAS